MEDHIGGKEVYEDTASALVRQYAEIWEDNEHDTRALDKQFKKGYRRIHKNKNWENADGRKHMGGYTSE